MTNTSSMPVRRPSAIGRIFRGFFNSFYVKRVFLIRVLPIMILTFLTYNIFEFSYWTWAKDRVLNLNNPDGQGILVNMLMLLLSALILGGIWYYVLLKAWQGAGARFYKFIILPAVVAVAIWLAVAADIISTGGDFFIVLIQLAFGAVVGIMFSMTIIDRYWSGTVSTTTVVQEDETHTTDHGPIAVDVDVHQQ